ncbi:IS1634 family transposase [Carboxylicivirga sp. N1Y90]|uniref:IS1634 family transposase n=1 Tax=Carboxylicivirga fragile TaxID=3417571 RepID=UPI003D33A470|nr:IS1634 family transposase [Marinilabiliaceae bacterium N1Y90]
MYVRKLKNRSGSTSVQVIQKINGRYKVHKTIGCATTQQNIEKLVHIANQEIEKVSAQPKLFKSQVDHMVEQTISTISNGDIRTVEPEIVFGKIYDSIGFNKLEEDLFRHLVIYRLAFPLSKLKTIEYLDRYQGVSLSIDSIYRFLDKLNNQLKHQDEQLAFAHTLKVLKGQINVVFYDMTTLYFEASDEDDLRKTGFSKDGKYQHPQIFIGLLVGLGGYAIGYDIFEGNTYEGHTLIPFIEQISRKFDLDKPVIVADAGLLSNDNIKALESKGYEYIIGGRLKNESATIKKQILADDFSDGIIRSYKKEEDTRLIVHYSKKRATKDAYNRKRGLMRLEKQVKSGKLTKSSINNRGYNKYLKLTGEVSIEIDYQKYNKDDIWDGLKGYVTNTKLSDQQVLENYKNLWHIEKAFRMSKTDLRIRPIYHRLRNRIEAHICISFTAYCIYKELERVLYQSDSTLSLRNAAELTHNIYQITYTLPDSKHTKSMRLKMDDKQTELCQIIDDHF